jgi:hypothetical protein
MRRSLLLLAGLLACADQPDRPSIDSSASDFLADTTPPPEDTHPQPPAARVVAPPAYLYDTARSDTVHRVDRYIVRLDTSWVIWRKPVALGIAFGAAAMPPDTVCGSTGYGFTATLLAITNRTPAELERASRCKAKVVLRTTRELLKGPTGCLVVDSAVARIRRWNWSALRPYLANGTIPAIEIADDIAREEEWCATPAVVLARLDQVACAVRDSAPGAPIAVRALATQLVGRTYQCITTVRAQYAGPSRAGHGHPDSFVVQQRRAAVALKLGVIFGLNLPHGGCGPRTNRHALARPHACLPGVPGDSIGDMEGNRFAYQMSAAEVTRYGPGMAAPGWVCGFIVWSWQYGDRFFAKPANVAAMKALSLIAAAHPATSCVQR